MSFVDAAQEINLNRNRQWFNELIFGKSIARVRKCKRFSGWDVKERKKELGPGMMVSESDRRGNGKELELLAWQYHCIH